MPPTASTASSLEKVVQSLEKVVQHPLEKAVNPSAGE
jgi:hypothetical protein